MNARSPLEGHTGRKRRSSPRSEPRSRRRRQVDNPVSVVRFRRRAPGSSELAHRRPTTQEQVVGLLMFAVGVGGGRWQRRELRRPSPYPSENSGQFRVAVPTVVQVSTIWATLGTRSLPRRRATSVLAEGAFDSSSCRSLAVARSVRRSAASGITTSFDVSSTCWPRCVDHRELPAEFWLECVAAAPRAG